MWYHLDWGWEICYPKAASVDSNSRAFRPPNLPPECEVKQSILRHFMLSVNNTDMEPLTRAFKADVKLTGNPFKEADPSLFVEASFWPRPIQTGAGTQSCPAMNYSGFK